MTEPVSSSTIIKAGLGAFDLIRGTGISGNFFPSQIKEALAAAERANRLQNRPTSPGPAEPTPPPPISPLVSGQISTGARTAPEFLRESRALVEGARLPPIFSKLPIGLIDDIFKAAQKIFKRKPKEKPLPKPKAPEKKPKGPNDPRFKKRPPPKRDRPIERAPEDVPLPGRARVPRPGGPRVPTDVPFPEPAPPEVVAKPTVKIKTPELPPAPAPIPAVVPAFITLAGIATGVGLVRAAGRSAGRARRRIRDTRPDTPSGSPLVPAQPTVPLGLSSLSLVATPDIGVGQGAAARLRNQLRQCKEAASRCEKKRRKKRRTCWKGFYVESTSRTSFEKWAKVDCRTGRQLPDRLQKLPV